MKHILVVEDERNLATGIKYNLEAEGYRATIASDGPSALRFVEDNQDGLDLVVLDLMLPGMSGYAVCEAIRASDSIIPILILSARSLAEDRTRGFDLGADQYLTKPFDLDEFLSRVRGLLNLYNRRVRRAAEDESAVRAYAFANVEIDFADHTVTVGGDPIRMTQLELRLLRYFVQNEGRLIPRRELLENVWGVPGNLNTRAPDQFILRLRKALEPDPAQPRHFLTLRDAGYRFLANPDAKAETPGKQ
jgi:DNA-binding response OmpR family regulator